MNFIQKHIQKRRKRYEATIESRIKDEFGVIEKGGSLWLTHDGRAFMRIGSEMTADGIAELLGDARIAAVTYASL